MSSEMGISINGTYLVAPEWTTGNEPEYSRADLHHLDAAMCGGSELAAKRPALIDLLVTAEAMRARIITQDAALRKAVAMLEHATVSTDWDEEEAAQAQAIWDADVASISAALLIVPPAA